MLFAYIYAKLFLGHTIEILNGERHQKIREKEHMIYAIQNFIQKIVEDLVDSVDNTSIDRIYRNSECKYMIINVYCMLTCILI
jgi:hypothetical protein